LSCPAVDVSRVQIKRGVALVADGAVFDEEAAAVDIAVTMEGRDAERVAFDYQMAGFIGEPLVRET
jgi:hypothetical protein